MKHSTRFYKLLLGGLPVVATVLLLVIQGIESIQQGSPSSASQGPFPMVRSSGTVVSFSGILLVGPDTTTWSQRAKFFSHTHLIHGWLYDLTEKNAKQFFKTIGDQGHVQIILENNKFKQYANDFKKLQTYYADTNVELRPDKQMKVTYTHAKTFFGNSGFVIQTANLTHSSLAKNKEHFFFGTHTGVLQSLQLVFAKDWSGETLTQSDIHPNLLICPINCREIIEYYLNNAQKSIWTYQQYITDPSLQQILIKKKKSGTVNVQIAVPDTADNKLLRELLGADVVHLIQSPYIHSKTILIDGKILLVGSMNGSANSLDNNREIGIILLDADAIAIWKKDFEKIRGKN